MAANIDPVADSRDADSLRKETLSATGDKVAETDSHDIVDSDETPYVVDKTSERALTRKFDLKLLPVLAVMVRSTPFCSLCFIIPATRIYTAVGRSRYEEEF